MDHYEAAGPWHVCLGEGTLEAYIRGVHARLGLEEESDAPFVAVGCCPHQGCVIVVLWRVQSNDVKGDDTGARGRAARPVRRGGVRQAPRVGGAAAKPTPRRAAQRGWCGETASCRAMPRWRERSSRGRNGAHARHMRRRTSGLCQLTLPPRSISRLSSASLPSLAACHTSLPIESLIAPAALYRPLPARTPAHSGGHARLRGDAREAAARTPSRCACSSPTRPSELGGPRQPCWREGASRTLEATTARSRGCRNAWLPRPRAAWCGRAKQLAKQAIGLDEGIGIGIGIGIGRSPARGSLNLSPPLALTYRQLLEQPRDETSVKVQVQVQVQVQGCLWRPRAAWCGCAKQLWLRTCAMQAIGLDEGIGRASRKRSPQ
jgi:hypothetical protein